MSVTADTPEDVITVFNAAMREGRVNDALALYEPDAVFIAQTGEQPLTGREAEIVQLLRGGLSNKEIARRLGIQEDTVKKHLLHVFAKLGVHRRAMVVLGGAASGAPTA